MSDAFNRSAGHGLKPQALGLSTAALVLVRDLVLQQTGQYFDDQKLDLFADKIADLVTITNSPSLLDYYYLLKYDSGSQEHWANLLDKLAVPETYFWRQFDQIDTLVKIVVPAFAKERAGETLHIWSAACCTGEEPLTIAMALDQAGWFNRMDIRIAASDASNAMVTRARSGIFGNRSMRIIPEDVKARYFTEQARGWQIDPAIHARVEWHVANLIAPQDIDRLARAEITFCRNVLIYFSDDAIRKVASMLAARMPSHGVLFLGASESLIRLSTDFRMIEIGDAFAYVPNILERSDDYGTTRETDTNRLFAKADF